MYLSKAGCSLLAVTSRRQPGGQATPAGEPLDLAGVSGARPGGEPAAEPEEPAPVRPEAAARVQGSKAL